ncbi:MULTISPECIES: hypothetical protein [unclassified Shewanella]|uniref:hypothetical protein n=1 Tax=unclassified Shewanella TaxID=196818 RepID=UPI0035502FD3
MPDVKLIEIIDHLSNLDFKVCCSLDVDPFLDKCIEHIEQSLKDETTIQLALSPLGSIMVNSIPASNINKNLGTVFYDSTACDVGYQLAIFQNIRSLQPCVSNAEKWLEVKKEFNQSIVFGLEQVVDSYPAARHYHFRMTKHLASILDSGSLLRYGLIEQPCFIEDSRWLTYQSTNHYLAKFIEDVSPAIESILVDIIGSSEGLLQAWATLQDKVKMSDFLDIRTRILLGNVNAYQIIRLMDRLEIEFLECEA